MPERMGQAIRQARTTRKLTLRDLAGQAGIPHTTLRDIEIGRVKSPRMDTIEAIASGLGVTVDWLIDGGNAPPDPTTIQLPANEVAQLLTEWSLLAPSQRELGLALIRALREHAQAQHQL